MNTGKYVLAQLLDWIHPQQFQRCVTRYGGDYKISQFSCWSQFVCLAFAQLTWRESLRDVEACLNSRRTQLYHEGLRGGDRGDCFGSGRGPVANRGRRLRRAWRVL